MDTTPSRDPLRDTDPTMFTPDLMGFEPPVFAAPEADPIPQITPAPPVAQTRNPRLRVLTAGAAVAGLAATAGIGLLLAGGQGGSTGTASTAADPAATAPTAATNPSGVTPADPDGTVPQDGRGHGGRGGFAPGGGTQTAPNAGSNVQPPSGAIGPGHAATGGS